MSYLVYLLLKGKNQTRFHEIKKVIFNKRVAIYIAYPKFHKFEEWNYIHMRKDECEFIIIKELKGAQHVPKISIEVIDFLKSFTYFYLEEFDNSYIRVFGVNVAPLKLPCYLNDKMVFLEFVR